MRIGKKTGVLIWAVFHAVLLLLGFSVPWKVDSDLYSVLPDSDELKSVSAAEKALSARTMLNISVLIGHENFEIARKAACTLDSLFRDDSSFVETRLQVNENAVAESREFFYRNRYIVQSKAILDDIRNGNAQKLESEALQKIYGSFSMANLNHLEADPFLLGESAFDYYTLQSPLMSGRFGLRDGVLSATDSGIAYVMWSGVLSPNAPSIASENHVLGRMNRVLDSLANSYGVISAKSGVPFHSYESSRKAQSEVAWISGASVVLILVLLLCVFRTPLPIVATLASIGLAVIVALASTWFIFGSIHVFTFVFGTSIIGVSIDYAVHFFIHWKSGCANIRAKILKGLVLGFLTTELSYIALTVANFPLLREMAVFSIVGLASSLFTIVFLFHALFDRKEELGASTSSLPLGVSFLLIRLYDSLCLKNRIVLGIIAATLLMALIPGLIRLNIRTDMRSLYTMSEELKSSEILNARLNNLGISANYFIVEGNSEDEVLQYEEKLVERLESARNDSLMKGFLAVSSFIPSLQVQQETRESVKRMLVASELSDSISLKPEIKRYLKEIGVQNDSAFLKSLLKAPELITPDKLLSDNAPQAAPQIIRSILNMLWIGPVDGKFYSAVLPLHVASKQNLHEVTEGLSHVYAVNKMENINNTLTNLSRISLTLVAIAYVVVFVILIAVYRMKTALRVIRAPVIACLFLASVFGYAGMDFNFFAIVGVILTLGIGIDYALFFREGSSEDGLMQTTTLAVMLSALTTVVSFGSLSFSSFMPVKALGLAVLLGILCCFLISPLSRKR